MQADRNVTRRQNLLVLYRAFAQEEVANHRTNGLNEAFAKHIQVSASLFSQMKGGRPIGDKLARQIEKACGRAAGWLDDPANAQASNTPDPALERFLALARQVWEASNSKGKRALSTQLRQALAPSAAASSAAGGPAPPPREPA